MRLGSLSEKYESNGNPGTIAGTRGDRGGPSYGLYQLSLNTGALKEYVKHSRFKDELSQYPLASTEFNIQWGKLAREYKEAFARDQHEYHTITYFNPVRRMADRYEIPDTNAVNQVLWSTATQHGVGWTRRQLKQLSGLTETEVINELYRRRALSFELSEYYNSSRVRQRIRDNVLNRFKQEHRDALALIQE